MSKVALFQPLALAIGVRYTRARRKSQFVSFISLVSMIGIAIGVLVLVTVLSVMNGFEQVMRERMLGLVAHVTVSESNCSISDWPIRRERLLQFPQVAAVSPFIEKTVLLNRGDEARGVLLQGIDPVLEAEVGSVFRHVESGDMHDLVPGSQGIAIGAPVAKELKVKVGDPVMLVSPAADADLTAGIPELQRFYVKAIFRMDLQQYDAAFAYANIEDVAEALHFGTEVTGLRIRLHDVYQALNVRQAILDTLGPDYPDLWVSDWTYQNTNFFKAIQMQKGVMFIILLLIVAVAAFNLVSTLVMVVNDKEGDIAILRTLGLSPGGVMRIFMVQGTLIGVIGTLVGVVAGLLLASHVDVIVPWIERLAGIHFINAEVYQISELVARVNAGDVFMITVSSLLMAVLATCYPAWRASKVQPAEALRYE